MECIEEQPKMEGFEKKLKEAEKLIDEGKFVEADGMFASMVREDLSSKEKSTLELKIGWYFYHLGTREIKDPIFCGREAEKYLSSVINSDVSVSDVTKALEILPLACQNLLRDHQKAVRFAEIATDRASLEDKPQALNRQGFVEREAGLLKSLKTFSEAYSAAREAKNFKEAGIALYSKAITLIWIWDEVEIAKEGLINEIRDLLSRAFSSYEEHERNTEEKLGILKINVEEKIQGLAFLVK